jgi:AcrR family transcriptional regulator
MPKTEEQNQEILDKRKEQILEASLEEFSQKGFSGTKISDIVKRAEISQGLLYHYYKSKDELYLAVIEKSTESAMILTKTVEKYNLRGWKAIVAMTEWIIQWLKSGGEGKLRFFFMQQAAMLKPMPEGVKEALIKSNIMNEFIVKLIKEGQEEGKIIEGNPLKLSAMYWGLVQGMIMDQVVTENIGLESEIFLPEVFMVLRIIKK